MTERDWQEGDDPEAMLNALEDGERTGTGMGPPAKRISDRKLRLFACAVWRLALARCGEALESDVQESRERLVAAVGVAEEWADGGEAISDDRHAVLDRSAVAAAGATVDAPSVRRLVPPPEQAALLRCIAGNPFQPVVVLPRDIGVVLAGIRANAGRAAHRQKNVILDGWLTPDALAIAQAAYDERDFGRLPVLADCLEEAGCAAPDVPCSLWVRGGGHEWHVVASGHGDGTPRLLRTFGRLRDARRWAKGERRASLERLSGKPACFGTGFLPREDHPLLAHLRLPGPHMRGCWAVDLVLGLE